MIKRESNLESKSLPGKVLRFEGKVAVIKIDNGQEILWPIKDLPDDIEVDEQVFITLSTQQTDDLEKEKLAKTILNQIFGNNDK